MCVFVRFGCFSRWCRLGAQALRRRLATAFFSPDIYPLVKGLRFSLKQVDEVSGLRYTFECCVKHPNGKFALLHASAWSSGSARGVKDATALAMKRLFDSVAPSSAPAEDRAPRSQLAQPRTPVVPAGSVSVSAPSSATGGNQPSLNGASAASLSNTSPPTLPKATRSATLPEFTGGVPKDPPPLPADIVVPELVGGGVDYEADADDKGRTQRAHQHARPYAAHAHRTRLEALALQQKAEVELAEDLVSSVPLKLCGGERRRLLLADLFNFYEIMAYYCKERLDLSQVVYEHLAPLATLGISVKIPKSHVRNAPLIFVPLKMEIRSQIHYLLDSPSSATWSTKRITSSNLCWTWWPPESACPPGPVLAGAGQLLLLAVMRVTPTRWAGRRVVAVAHWPPQVLAPVLMRHLRVGVPLLTQP